jgi:hypothetical protein
MDRKAPRQSLAPDVQASTIRDAKLVRTGD